MNETSISSTPSERSLTLEQLGRMSTSDLEALYRQAESPTELAALNGHPEGRMLAIRAIESTMLASPIARFAFARAFPWEGKSFMSGKLTGTGVNRVKLGGRHNLFPFTTRIGPSVIDQKPCVILDYDLADNPKLIRMIHDEVRQVSTELYLGPAMWKAKSSPQLVLWFALDFDRQVQAIGLPRVYS